MKWTIIVIAIVAAAACTSETSAPPVERQPLEQAGPTIPESPRDDIDPETERAGKKAAADAVPGTPIVQDVQWKAVETAARVDAALLPASERRDLAAIDLPVVVPNDAALLGTALITHNRNWYAVRTKGEGITVYIRGTRIAHEVPGIEEVQLPDYTLSRTHGIVTIAFQRFGAAYNMDVECFGAADDRRCIEDDFAIGVYERLAVVGGDR